VAETKEKRKEERKRKKIIEKGNGSKEGSREIKNLK